METEFDGSSRSADCGLQGRAEDIYTQTHEHKH